MGVVEPDGVGGTGWHGKKYRPKEVMASAGIEPAAFKLTEGWTNSAKEVHVSVGVDAIILNP